MNPEEFSYSSIDQSNTIELMRQKYEELSQIFNKPFKEDPMFYMNKDIQNFVQKIKTTYSKEILDKCLLWYVIILATPEVKIEDAVLDVPDGEIEKFIRDRSSLT